MKKIMIFLLLCLQVTHWSKAATDTLNFIWINHGKHGNALVFGEGASGHGPEDCLNHIEGWAAKAQEYSKSTGRGMRLILWYDGATTTETQVSATQTKLASTGLTLQKIQDMAYFQDLAPLKIYSETFEEKWPKLSRYFRVDITRPIVMIHAINQKLQSAAAGAAAARDTEYQIFADLDMTPGDIDAILAPGTKEKLSRFGLVASGGGILGFENGFQIAVNDDRELLEALKTGLVLPNTRFALRGRGSEDQVVYNGYPQMMKYLLALKGYGTLGVERGFCVQPDPNTPWKECTAKPDLDGNDFYSPKVSKEDFFISALINSRGSPEPLKLLNTATGEPYTVKEIAGNALLKPLWFINHWSLPTVHLSGLLPKSHFG